VGEWQAQGEDFDTQGRGQGTAAERDAKAAWVLEYSVGFFFLDGINEESLIFDFF